MIIVPTGGPERPPSARDVAWLSRLGVTEVWCGSIDPAVLAVVQWAETNGVPVVRVLADWTNGGEPAGKARDRAMLDRCVACGGAVVVFPAEEPTFVHRYAELIGAVVVTSPSCGDCRRKQK